jgi:hypothetical protein
MSLKSCVQRAIRRFHSFRIYAMGTKNPALYDAIFCISPHNPGWLQRRIREVQEAKGLAHSEVTHCGVLSTFTGVEMRIPFGGYVNPFSEYGADHDIYICRRKGGAHNCLFENAERRIVGRPYGLFQLAGVFLKYVLCVDLYGWLPGFIREFFEICSEAVYRASLDIGDDFLAGVEPDYVLPCMFADPEWFDIYKWEPGTSKLKKVVDKIA